MRRLTLKATSGKRAATCTAPDLGTNSAGPFVRRPRRVAQLLGERFVLALAHVDEAHALGARGGVLVVVHGDRPWPPTKRPKSRATATASSVVVSPTGMNGTVSSAPWRG